MGGSYDQSDQVTTENDVWVWLLLWLYGSSLAVTNKHFYLLSRYQGINNPTTTTSDI